MIIVKIFQGIGNQLCQYAYGRARGLDLGVEFKIDNSYYINYSEVTQYGFTYKRDYGLDHFNILNNVASEEEIRKVKTVDGSNRITYYINKKLHERAPYYRKRWVKEKETVFDPNLLRIKDNTYVEGYFVSELYFRKHRNVILKEFTLKNPVNEKNAEVIKRMQNTDSVCISIRRTNFLANPIMNVCREQYYTDGLKAMADMLGKNMRVFIFSDDNEWVLNNYKIPYEHEFVTHNFPDFYEDLRLMTYCRNHVIPNSTFSWWGAWLTQNEDKKIIAPKIWLNSDEDYSTVIPESWIKLENKF